MKAKYTLYTCTVLSLVIGLVCISTAKAQALSEAVATQIQQEFDTRLKDNPYNTLVKSIEIKYDPANTSYIACNYVRYLNHPELTQVTILFGDQFILHSQVNKYVIAPALAHELGHVHTIGVTPHESEFLADEYGLKMFIASGGTKEQFASRLIERASEESDTHPADLERYRVIMSK